MGYQIRKVGAVCIDKKCRGGGTTDTFVMVSLVRVYVQTNQCRVKSPIKGHSFKLTGSESFPGVFMSHYKHCMRFYFSRHQWKPVAACKVR